MLPSYVLALFKEQSKLIMLADINFILLTTGTNAN